MKTFAKYFFPALCCCVFSTASGQDTVGQFALKPTAFYGFIAPHSTGMKNLIRAHVPAFELALELPATGRKDWEILYRYPSWGLSWYYADLRNPEETGIATGLYPFVNFPLIRRSRFLFQYRLGWGMAYLSKRFERVENHKNIVIGSHINAIIGMRLETAWQLSGRLYAHTNLALTHFSNGAYKMPNLGFNILAAGAGFSCRFGDVQPTVKDEELPIYIPYMGINLVLAGGVKEIYPSGG
ncbi:MAG: acyloxyacyl hydrolase, partial [Flavobacteriales bacterium]